MIRYRLPLSKTFPAYHPRKGESTDFDIKLFVSKLHTIRENYHYWAKRIDKINAGVACLEIYQWTGTPYYSKCKTIFTLYGGLGYQKIDVNFKVVKKKKTMFFKIDGLSPIGCTNQDIFKNDGLSEEDFLAWFKKGVTGAIIIHFSKLRY